MKPTLRQIEEREKQKKEKRQIDTLIKYDRAKICPKCGELMRYAFGEVFKCDNCGAEEMTSFGKVRKYIEDHGPSNAANISDGTGVPVSTINRYLREGRIENSKDTARKSSLNTLVAPEITLISAYVFRSSREVSARIFSTSWIGSG